MSDKLLPCPFCGGEGKRSEVAGQMPTMWPVVQCGSCHNRSIAGRTEAEAITIWNTRAPAIATVDLREGALRPAVWLSEEDVRATIYDLGEKRGCNKAQLWDVLCAMTKLAKDKGVHSTPATTCKD